MNSFICKVIKWSQTVEHLCRWAGEWSVVIQGGLSRPSLSEVGIPSEKRVAWPEMSETLRSLRRAHGLHKRVKAQTGWRENLSVEETKPGGGVGATRLGRISIKWSGWMQGVRVWAEWWRWPMGGAVKMAVGDWWGQLVDQIGTCIKHNSWVSYC